MGASGSNGGDVIDTTAREADSPPSETPADTTVHVDGNNGIDPRILGTYDGDGSMKSIKSQQRPPVVGGIVLTPFIFTLALILLTVVNYLLSPHSSPHWKAPALIISGVVAWLWLVYCLIKFRHYIYAVFRYGAGPANATYWMKNSQLRLNCRKPHDANEFFELVKLAEAADHKLALAYVAKQTEAYYHRLISDRGLGYRRLPDGTIAGYVLNAEEHVTPTDIDDDDGPGEESEADVGFIDGVNERE